MKSCEPAFAQHFGRPMCNTGWWNMWNSYGELCLFKRVKKWEMLLRGFHLPPLRPVISAQEVHVVFLIYSCITGHPTLPELLPSGIPTVFLVKSWFPPMCWSSCSKRSYFLVTLRLRLSRWSSQWWPCKQMRAGGVERRIARRHQAETKAVRSEGSVLHIDHIDLDNARCSTLWSQSCGTWRSLHHEQVGCMTWDPEPLTHWLRIPACGICLAHRPPPRFLSSLYVKRIDALSIGQVLSVCLYSPTKFFPSMYFREPLLTELSWFMSPRTQTFQQMPNYGNRCKCAFEQRDRKVKKWIPASLPWLSSGRRALHGRQSPPLRQLRGTSHHSHAVAMAHSWRCGKGSEMELHN